MSKPLDPQIEAQGGVVEAPESNISSVLTQRPAGYVHLHQPLAPKKPEEPLTALQDKFKQPFLNMPKAIHPPSPKPVDLPPEKYPELFGDKTKRL